MPVTQFVDRWGLTGAVASVGVLREAVRNLTLVLALTLVPAGMAAAQSSYPDLSIFANAEIVPDAELAEMRGRYIEGGQVKYFGIQFFTLWQTADGMLLTTGLEWTADAAGNAAVPRASFLLSTPDGLGDDLIADLAAGGVVIDGSGAVISVDPGAAGAPTALPATANAGGLETASGLVQSVQAAGDVNNIGNDIRFNVTNDGAAISFAAPLGPLGEAMDLLETTTVEIQPGAKATAFVEPNAVGTVVNIANLGTVMQEVRGGIGRAAQHANVRGNVNFIRNSMNINFSLAPSTHALRLNIGSTLALTRGIRQ